MILVNFTQKKHEIKVRKLNVIKTSTLEKAGKKIRERVKNIIEAE